jgi:hypothetical protein
MGKPKSISVWFSPKGSTTVILNLPHFTMSPLPHVNVKQFILFEATNLRSKILP